MQFKDETEADLRGLIERDFGALPHELANRTVLDWMHYRARLIPRRPREVVLSGEALAQMADYPAVKRLKTEFERGGDVSPWLSDRVRRRKADAFADLMFNDWQISHFHLGTLFVAPNKVARKKQLLFALVKADRAVFLAVNPHGAWTATELLRILLRTSPKDLPELKGVVRPRDNKSWTDAELVQLRKANLGYSIGIDGRTFCPPGMGISTSGHATRIVAGPFKLLSRGIRDLSRRLTANDLPRQHLRQLLVLGVPVRLGLRLRDDGCLVLQEKARAIDLLALPAFE